MPLTLKFEELDAETRDYLHAVRSAGGRGMPGIFMGRSNSKPLWAVIIGSVVGLGLFVVGFNSAKDPWAIAMVQTAGVLVGGWSWWYAIRRWTAGKSAKYGGYFTYFDPLHAYAVNGETVSVVSLRTVRGVEAHPASGGARVEFDLGDRDDAVPVPSLPLGQLVEDYYDAMEKLENREDGAWVDVAPAELGAAARYVVEEDEVPRGVNDLHLDIQDVPEDVGRDNRAGFGLLGLTLIVAAGVACFFVLWGINVPLGDEVAFSNAKDGGAPGLRGYLLDERNTRHREEAKQLLSKCYDEPVNRLKAAGPGQAKPGDLRGGMAALLDSLRAAEVPVVSLAVTEAPGTVGGGQLKQELADGLARSVDTKGELLAFVAPPEGEKAHLTITTSSAGNATLVAVTIRTDIKADPVASASWSVPVNDPVTGAMTASRLKELICIEMVGRYTPAPMNFDFGGGDF